MNHAQHDHVHRQDHGQGNDHRMMTDPVCGMKVDPASAAGSATHGGKTYYFCGKGCLAKFNADPDRYAGARTSPAPAAAQGTGTTTYTCPMHPEVRQDHPGACPKCGMALELVTPVVRTGKWTCPMHPQIVRDGPGDCPICGMALEPMEPGAETDDTELRDMSRRFWIGLALSVPLVFVAMSMYLPRNPLGFLGHARMWMELGLATPVVLWCGWPLLVRGAQSVANRNLNMFTLIALGVTVAYVYSVAAALAPGIFPPSIKDAHGEVGAYFEAAAAIVTLVLLGQVLELRARSRTNAAIRELLKLAPTVARRIRPDGTDEDVPLEALHPGERLRIRPGERVPVDGVVIEGTSAVDESMLTGESMPVTRRAGDKLIGGTLNGSGGLVMEARAVGADTMLSRIVHMVAEAQRSRAPVQRLVDRVSAIFVPAVIATAIVTFFTWLLVGPEPRLAYAVVNAVAVLIIACPCALGLATPMSIMVGVGRGASMGVLFKDAQALETLRLVDTLVLDKTGTITVGKPTLVSVIAAGGMEENDVVRLAASLERASEHPLAKAVVAGAHERKIGLDEVTEFDTSVGKGVTGRVAGKPVAVGNRLLMEALTIDVSPYAARAEALRKDGQTVIYVVSEDRLAGMLGIADPIKATSREAIDLLNARARARRHAHRGQPHNGERRGEPSRYQGSLCRGPAGSKVGDREAAESGRTPCGDGWGRHQRRSRARSRRCGYRHGYRHRCRHRKRGGYAGEGRPPRHRPRAQAVHRDLAQHQAEPLLRLRLQPARRAGGGGYPVSLVRYPALPCRGGGGHELLLGVGDRQRAAPAPRPIMSGGERAPS